MRWDLTRHAITLDEYRELEPTLTRPMTDKWRRSPRVHVDAHHSRLVQPRPRKENAA